MIQLGGSYLLDTNILIALLAGERAVLRKLASGLLVYVPSISLGELYFGALKSSRPRSNLPRVDEVAARGVVLDADSGTARQYGEVKQGLHSLGRPIPDNDMWIAAIAIQHGLTLVSRDPHFGHIRGLRVEQW